MATKKTTAVPAKFVGVDALKHADDKRCNIPTEYQSLLADETKAPVQVSYARAKSSADHLKDEKAARHTDLDPQLVWRGKDAQDWSSGMILADEMGRARSVATHLRRPA